MKLKDSAFGLAALAVFCLLAAPGARADNVNEVTVNTGATNVGGTQQAEIIFSLVDGNGDGDGNNTVTLSDLSFGSGASLDPAVDTSNVLGTIGSGVSMTDSIFDSSIGILFNPGSTVSFLLDLTTNSDSSGTPDAFSFVMFDTNGNIVTTADTSGANTILTLNLDGSSTGAFQDSSFVTLTPQMAATPEPGTLFLFATGLAGLLALGLRRRWPRLIESRRTR